MDGPGVGPPREAAGEEVGSGRRPGTHDDVVARVRTELDAVLSPHLAAPGPYAVVGYPRGRNTGEYLLWLGTVEHLRRRGVAPAYICDRTDYSRAALAARVGSEGTILLAGGGNLGDLWPPEQQFRERVIEDFPDLRIVQLPQSMHFRSEPNLTRAQEVFGDHPELLLLLRDPISEASAREAFGAERTALCPDMAFGMPPLPPSSHRADGILWLGRTDRESLHPPTDELPAGVRRWDWASGHGRPFAWAFGRRLGSALVGDGNRQHLAALTRAGHGLVAVAGRRSASDHLARGVAGMLAAEVVVTDRFHGHILAFLLGRPQVVLDNGDGKVHSFVRRWTSRSPLVHLATSAGEALEKATALLRGGLP